MVILLLVLNTSAQQIHYVQPDSIFLPQDSLTFQEYIEDVEWYFTTGSVFVFLAGDHIQQTTLNLISVANITFRGNGNDSDINTFCGSEVTIRFYNVTNMTIEGIRFILNCRNIYNIDPSVLKVSNSKHFWITSSIFRGSRDILRDLARAIHSTNSSIMITSCLFDGNTAENGGAIAAKDRSNITITDCIFTRNGAVYGGGAIYAYESYITLLGTSSNEFQNSLAAEGGAIGCRNCFIEMIGHNNFESNCVREGGSGGAIVMYDGLIEMIGHNNFESNCAKGGSGGAIAMYSGSLRTSGTINFFKNEADLGGAICLHNSSIYTVEVSAMGRNNYYFKNNSATDRGGAILCLSTCYIEMEGHANFENNHLFGAITSYGGAIATSGGNFTFIGTALFSNNKAFAGGAMVPMYCLVEPEQA